MKGNHTALWKAPQYKYLFLNFLMKTAPLDDNCPFAEAKLRAQLLLQSEPLGKERAGAVVRDAIHNAAFIQALILRLGLYGTTAGIFHKLSQFPRQNCCEEVCFLTEAWEPRVIFRKYRRAFIHLPLSFSFPLPRLLGPLTLSGWQCHLPHHDGERDLGKGGIFLGDEMF